MQRTLIFNRVAVVIPLLIFGAALAAPTAALASNPGPIQISIQSFSANGAACPGGTYVTVSPGPINSPTFVLISPGPVGCPAGIDVLKDPGPAQTPVGKAIALPLTAASCGAGTALFTQELSLIGGSLPGPTGSGSPGPAAGPCPSGDAALAALRAALANVPAAGPGSFAFAFHDSGPINFPTFVLANPGPINAPALSGAYLLDRAGTPRGTFVLKDPGPIQTPHLYVLAPSGTPGVAVLKDPGPIG